MKPQADDKSLLPRWRDRYAGVSLRDLTTLLVPVMLLSLAAIWAALWFLEPAPPNHLTITAGPDNSVFRITAEKYRDILARSRVKLQILSSSGSLENLRRLADPAFRVDVGFVQGGVAAGVPVDKLVSLGSVFHQPLLLFYRAPQALEWLSDLRGRRLAIGPEGSGTRELALTLLKANGIEPGGLTALLDLAGEEAAQAVVDGKADAAFLMGDSAALPTAVKLLRTPGVRLFGFKQADAYTRHFRYLNALTLPMGAFDLGKNEPAQDTHLIGPTVELVAREKLHPALSDLLIETAQQVHGGATLMQRAGEFPAPLEHEFRVSDEARRYYRSGKGFMYRSLPFWLASLVDRALFIVVPVVFLLLPGLRWVPSLYRWRIRSRIYRWYGALIALERSALANPTAETGTILLKRLDDIDKAVNTVKVPLAFAEHFYILRGHIRFVRDRLQRGAGW
jgi:hypothetical protein